jgi:photosystem II stability/assembly factor-like uncharacterized protein
MQTTRSPNHGGIHPGSVLLGLLALGAALVLGGSWVMARRYRATHVRYVWNNVAIRGGGFVTGVVFHPGERGLMYARTDVGGAYRWDSASASWSPLLDALGPADWNLQGVESIAVDPTDAARVYAAVGTYTNADVSNGEILRSNDAGRTWRRVPLPFKLGANEAGRGSGERLVVDPNDPRVLYFGTRRSGLWRSSDSAVTWARVASFPDVVDGSAAYPPEPGKWNYLSQAVGIVFVRLDSRSGRSGAPTPVLYAAVSTSAESVFVSRDAGATWSPLSGQPTGLRPNRSALGGDGSLYLTYADEPGPNRMRDGALFKLDPARGQWTDVTPERRPAGTRRFGYAGVAVDAERPSVVMVSTWNREPFDEVFRSTDGGAHWTPLIAGARWDHAGAPYTEAMHAHWMSDVEIDPFDSKHALFTTGYGIWATHDAEEADAGRPVRWSFDDRGLEETVPLALVSPPRGAHLVSGVGDIDGFRHDDLSMSPRTGRFDAPGYKNTEWLDVAPLDPDVFVRSGTTYGSDRILGAISRDGATHWKGFTAQPPRPPGSAPFGTGPIAVSADGRRIVWTVRGEPPYASTDDGASWVEVAGAPRDLRVIADRVDPSRWYGVALEEGALYASRDGAASFALALRGLPVVHGWRAEHLDVRADPRRSGELWIATGDALLRVRGAATLTPVTSIEAASSVGFGQSEGGQPAVFVAGRHGGISGIFESDDDGATWVRLNDDQHQFGSPSHLTGDPRVGGRVYFATGGRGIVYGDRL